MRNPLWRGALSLSGQLKIAGAGDTNVYAVGVRLRAEKTRVCRRLASCRAEHAVG